METYTRKEKLIALVAILAGLGFIPLLAYVASTGGPWAGVGVVVLFWLFIRIADTGHHSRWSIPPND